MFSRSIPFLSLAAAALFPIAFMGFIAGDAVIHMVFAENAMHGDWFSYNPGEPSAGETSAGYMVVVMLIMQLFGLESTPYIMVGAGYVAWLATLLLYYRLWRKLFPDSMLPYLGILVIGLMPGAVLNSVLGMENVYFALGSVGVLTWLYHNAAFEQILSPGKMLQLGALLGLLTLLRPEATLFAAGVIAWQWLWLVRVKRLDWVRAGVASIVMSGIALLMFGGMLYAGWSISGTLPFGGGTARLNLAAANGISLGPIYLHAKILTRLLAYFPLLLAFLMGLFVLLRGLNQSNRGLIALVAMLVMGFGLAFSTILPTTHLARYTIFYWPLVATVGMYGIYTMRPQLVKNPKVFTVVSVCLCLALGSIYSYEFYLRKQGPAGHPLDIIAASPANRVKETDKLLNDELGYTGRLPVNIGLVEVQARYFYDDRIIIRSMDGIVDSLFNSFFDHGFYDYEGYMRAREIKYLLDYEDLNKSVDDWSPAELKHLEPGKIVERNGIRFERLPGDATALTYIP